MSEKLVKPTVEQSLGPYPGKWQLFLPAADRENICFRRLSSESLLSINLLQLESKLMQKPFQTSSLVICVINGSRPVAQRSRNWRNCR